MRTQVKEADEDQCDSACNLDKFPEAVGKCKPKRALEDVEQPSATHQ
eukprot:CAMPEP_0115132458 /NCGR_PEP_ID=MMETSP0227-20121206/53761_1 /TAXON_ID=89957 /ORGANISM="Polarella glacialis, Strain CCMP 1383" /LENGTH=46 /DNA_ID= /DNA_START= /DNA_END= /DNA_ORIENTATION=